MASKTRKTVIIDRQPVAVGVARAYYRLKAAFERAFPGLTLVVTFGIRTRQQQADLFYSRYVTYADLRGRRYSDTIRWQGKTWYNVSGQGRAAPPGHSNHEVDGPSGGRALDIRDTGSDPGVTAYGNKRSAWIKKNAGECGFRTTGYDYFNEPWHIELIGDPWAGEAPAGEETPAPAPEPEPEEEEDDMYKPTVHVRTEGPFEATLAHPGIGADLEQHTGPGTGGKRTEGKVTVYRGFMVTADLDTAVAWARTFAKGNGNETSRTDRAGYITIQVEASRIAVELAAHIATG